MTTVKPTWNQRLEYYGMQRFLGDTLCCEINNTSSLTI